MIGKSPFIENRSKSYVVIVVVASLIIWIRLFYWQILAREELDKIAQNQRNNTANVPASRGKILANDGYPIVNNEARYTLFSYQKTPLLNYHEVSKLIAPLIADSPLDREATGSGYLSSDLIAEMEATLSSKLQYVNVWTPLKRNINELTKQAIEKLNIPGFGFDKLEARSYPEASMAAQLVGIVGSDEHGQTMGYGGIEGKYEVELAGRPGMVRQEKDALGRPIVAGNYQDIPARDGRTLVTYLDRGVQYLIERGLEYGLERYQAKAGEIIVVNPVTGGIIGLATLPSFDPKRFYLYPSKNLKNPSISDTYEPGSTFKTLIMAAGINEKLVSPNTICDSTCDGPVEIGKYTIKTWNNKYQPGQTMQSVLTNSDNTGMVFVANRLGQDKMIKYIKDFGIGELTNIDLTGEASSKLRNKWGDIDLATASFGQGLTVTTIQMLMAVSSIASSGNLMEPHVVSKVIDGTTEIIIPPKVVRQVISKETAAIMTDMMRDSATHGDAKWATPKSLDIAGKTGTAQVAIEGHYDAEKTTASFVGFAPAGNPKFAMIVKLREPGTSIWASETAAPLWFKIAGQIFDYYGLDRKIQ